MSVEKTLHHYGFSLRSVTWGYRDIFKTVFEKLFAEEYLGPANREVTGSFFSFMQCADEQFFDHVLKEFLEALAGEQKWILSIPSLFEGIVELGHEFAREKLYFGIDYFKILKDGGFGKNPAEISHCITICKRLFAVDSALAHAFLHGYKHLISRLGKAEIDRYVDYGLTIYKRNKSAAVKFLQGELQTSETYIREMTKEIRLRDIDNALVRHAKALSGIEIRYDDLSKLDSDEVIGRGTRFVQLYRWVYLPHLIRYYSRKALNRNVYDLLATVAGGMLAFKSFPSVHGHPEYESCSRICGYSMLRENLFMICEYTRVLRLIQGHWPGAAGLLSFIINEERKMMPPATPPDILFFDCWDTISRSATETVRRIIAISEQSVNCFHTLRLLDDKPLSDTALQEYPGVDRVELRSFSFLPDFRFPAEVTAAPPSDLIEQLKKEASGPKDQQSLLSPPDGESVGQTGTTSPTGENEAERTHGPPCYLYDEWSVHENCYYTDHCRLHEMLGEPGKRPDDEAADVDDAQSNEVRNVRRLFELIKPELPTKEKLLSDGDSINPDKLVQYIINKKVEASPKINFYERTFLNKRDLAVVLLLDISGSTGEESAGETIINTIKKSAVLLGEGLNTLDDRFAICGFSGTGREDCKYFIYKDFEDPWNREVVRSIHSAQPLSSTRIGPALRHSGFKLSSIEAKKRLVLLITDGRPMDKEYDASTHYAQYDVRRACEENRRLDIHTFCISTNENSRADMEIMFPHKRFVILEGFHDLPAILPRLYLRLTV